MAYYQRIWAQIDPDGIVQNRAIFDDYETANQITRYTYGEGSVAVDINRWDVTVGDKYIDNTFYAPDGVTPRDYIPDVEERLTAVENKSSTIESTVNNEISTNAVSFMAARFMAASFTDEQAVLVPDLYEKWSVTDKTRATIHYSVGDRRRYGDDNTLYKCITEHDAQESWNPVDAPSLWTKILIPDPGVVPDWEQPESTNGYSIGDRVKHNDKTWESLVNNNVWEPGVVGTEALWKEVAV